MDLDAVQPDGFPVMFPIGGAAKLARSPEPREEIWITAAGPLVNFLIAGLILGLVVSQGNLTSVPNLTLPTPENLLLRLAASNLGLGIFNLLPAFPMDGGRLLRAFLALSLAALAPQPFRAASAKQSPC